MLTRNQNINEINSISANVRVSPMPQPPSYDFATKNLEPIGNGTSNFRNSFFLLIQLILSLLI